jgi:hypothetical protein
MKDATMAPAAESKAVRRSAVGPSKTLNYRAAVAAVTQAFIGPRSSGPAKDSSGGSVLCLARAAGAAPRPSPGGQA